MARPDEQLAALLHAPINRVLASLWERVEDAYVAEFMGDDGVDAPLDEAGRTLFMVNSVLAIRQELDELYRREPPI